RRSRAVAPEARKRRPARPPRSRPRALRASDELAERSRRAAFVHDECRPDSRSWCGVRGSPAPHLEVRPARGRALSALGLTPSRALLEPIDELRVCPPTDVKIIGRAFDAPLDGSQRNIARFGDLAQFEPADATQGEGDARVYFDGRHHLVERSQRGARFEHGDRAQPAAQGLWLAKFSDALERASEDLLSEIVELGVPAEDAGQDPFHVSALALEKRALGPRLSVAQGTHELVRVE